MMEIIFLSYSVRQDLSQSVDQLLDVLRLQDQTSPSGLFLSKPMHHDWCTKGRGMYYAIYGMLHIKDLLLLVKMSDSQSGGCRFPVSLSMHFFTPYIQCQYNCNKMC